MARVSNRQILEAIDMLAEDITEAVGGTPYPDPLTATLTLDKGEYYGIKDVLDEAAKCYQTYHGNPLFRRAVDLRSQYVWGRGVTLMSPQEQVNNVIREFLDRNADELGHQGRTEKDKTLSLEGNLFLLCHTDEMGAVTIRQVPLTEITESRRDPDDYRTVWFWKRTYTEYTRDGTGTYGTGTEVSTYHPALGYDPEAKPVTINDLEVKWDQPVLHAPLPRIGKEVFAMPPFLTALPWATAYSHFLSNIATIAASLARFAWRATAKTPAGAKRLHELLDTGTGEVTGVGGAKLEPTAARFVSTEGTKLEPIKTAGVATSADEGRRFALMVASGTDVPEHMLMGDPSTGNLATTKSMERPFELSILDRQMWWADVLETLLTYAVISRVRAVGYNPLTGDVEEDEFGRTRIMVDVTRANDATTRSEEPDDTEPAPVREEAEIVVEFPSVLEHDMVSEVAAIIDMATLRGQKPAGIVDRATLRRLLLSALNTPDVDDLIANMDPAELEAVDEPENPSPFMLAAPPLPGDGREEEQQQTEEALNNVAKALREVVRAAEVNR